MKASVIHKSSPRSAFTLIELLVVIAIIGILAAITIPVVGRVRYSAHQVKSTANLRSIGQGMSLFLEDNRDRFPGHGNAGKERCLVRLAVYMNSPHGLILDEKSASGENYKRMADGYRVPAFHYPTVPVEAYTSGNPRYISDVVGCYGLNVHLIKINGANEFWGRKRSDITVPSRTILAGERYSEDATGGYYINSTGPYTTANKEGLASNIGIRQSGIPANAAAASGPSGVLFVDMHVQNVRLETLNPYPERQGINPVMIFVVD